MPFAFFLRLGHNMVPWWFQVPNKRALITLSRMGQIQMHWMSSLHEKDYHQISNISHTLVGNKIVDQ